MQGEVYAGRREAAGDGGASRTYGKARLQIGSRARGGAYVEHKLHVCNLGRVEAQRLVERRRALPGVEKRACARGEVRAGRREAAGNRGVSRT